MNELAILLKALNIYGHACHFLCSRVVFMQDHIFLGEIYEAAEDNYDAVVERCIGLGIKVDIQDINVKAAARAASIKVGDDNSTKLSGCLSLEQEVVAMIEKLRKGGSLSLGTETLLGDIASESEIRQYKLKQRLA